MPAFLKDSLIVVACVLVVGTLYIKFPALLETKASNTSNTSNVANNLSTNSKTMSEESKLHIEVVKQGEGAGAQKGQMVTVDYTGKLQDGTVFDSSIPRGQPFVFPLGQGQVIQGWDQGLLDMKVGEERILTIPPELAYGPSGINGVIPPNATLIFEVKMISIK